MFAFPASINKLTDGTFINVHLLLGLIVISMAVGEVRIVGSYLKFIIAAEDLKLIYYKLANILALIYGYDLFEFTMNGRHGRKF